MKLLSRLLSKSALVCAGIALLTLAQTAGAAPQQGTAVARSVSGTAEYSTGGAWAPLKSGTELAAGTTIRTAADGEVSLGLGENGKAIVIAPSSILTIDKLTFERTGADTVTETQLDLKALAMSTRPQPPRGSRSRHPQASRAFAAPSLTSAPTVWSR
jgi:hypothetical protein